MTKSNSKRESPKKSMKNASICEEVLSQGFGYFRSKILVTLENSLKKLMEIHKKWLLVEGVNY